MNTTARLRSFSRIASVLALATLGIASTEPAAAAGSQLCRQIEAQLASLGRPAGGQARRYDRAIRAQEIELDKMRTRAAYAGCDGFFGGLRGQCGSLKSTISSMESNLASLQRQRAGMSGVHPRERARLIAARDANGCGAANRKASLRQAPGVPKTRLAPSEQLFDGKATHWRLPENSPAAAPGDTLRGSTTAAGSYRTLCVRTCDGYFFPIAYSSSPAAFDRDARACEAACPGTEVELFRHSVPGEEAEEAVSTRTGRPYSDLPNALLYRKAGYSRPATCGCNPPKGFSIVAGGNYTPQEPAVAEAADMAAQAAKLPPDGVAAAEVPEPVPANARLETAATGTPDKLTVAPSVTEEPITSSVADKNPAERRVRVVGPTFLPDPEGAIDLRAPGRKEVR